LKDENKWNITIFLFVCRGGFAEVLCKPKIMPLKSAVLEQLQKIENAEFNDAKDQAS